MKLTFSQRRKRYEAMVASLLDWAQLVILAATAAMVVALLWHNLHLGF